MINRLVRWALWSLAVVLILAAVYVSLGRQLMPVVEQYRSELEQQLQERFEQAIYLEELEGGWRGFSPLLTARHVTFGEGDDALQIESLQLQPDVLASILAGELRLHSVTLTGLHLQVQQDEQGQWALQGVVLRNPEQAVFELNDLLAKLQDVGRVRVLDSRVIVQAAGQDPLALTYAGLTLSQQGAQQRLDVSALLPDGEALEFSAQGRLIQGDWRKSALSVYLKTPRTDLVQWLPPHLVPDWQLSQLQAGGELWLEAAQGQIDSAVLRLHSLALAGRRATAQPVRIATQNALAAYRRDASGQQLWFEHLDVQLDDLPARDMRLSGRYQPDDGGVWQLDLAQLNIADVHHVLERVMPLPEVAADVLQSMQPRGTLQNLQVQWQPEAPLAQRLRFASNVEAVEFSAWHNVPASSGISGYISGDLLQGELRLAS